MFLVHETPRMVDHCFNVSARLLYETIPSAVPCQIIVLG